MTANLLKLIIEQNQFSYTGAFSRPALSLWNEGEKIFKGLITAFESFGVDLTDIRVEVINQSPAGQLVIADLDLLGRYGFRFNQVEWLADDLDEPEIAAIPQVLQRGDDWLRSVINDFSFKSHTLSYSSHSQLSEGTSQDFLKRFLNRELAGVGTSLGSGIFYHWEVSDLEGYLHLSVDHSRIVSDGLFVQVNIEVSKDRLNFEQAIVTGRTKVENALAQIGLEFERLQ